MAQAPALEQERGGIRLNASGELAELGGLAQRLARGNQPLDTLPLGLGGGVAQGISAIGDGVKSVGQAIFNIQERAAEARNYRAVHEAQSAMDREAGEFEKWKVQNANRPELWEAEWNNRVRSFGDNYTSGKDLSPAAKEGINLRLNSFAESQAVRVGVDSVKAQAGLAREAIDADYYRAIEAGDADTAISLSRYGFEQGFIPEDVAARMEIGAVDAVETKTLEVLQNQKKTALAYGDISSALKAVDAMPIREDEKALEKAVVTEQYGYQETMRQAEDILDPAQRIAALQSDAFNNLRPSDKQKMLDASFREMNEEVSMTVNGLKDDISLGGVASEGDLEFRDDFKALPQREKIAVRQFLKQGALNDIAEFSTLQRAIRGYDPSVDPRGAEKAELERSIALRFDGERADELSQTLQEATQRTGPQSAAERVLSDVFTDLQKRYEAGDVGNFRVTGDQISERVDENGVTLYTVPDPGGDFKKKGLLGTYTGRVIELSEQDRIRFKEKGKDSGEVFEDRKAKDAAFSRFLNVQQEVELKVKAGEITEADEIQAEVNRLLGGEVLGALETRLQKDGGGNSLPGMSSGRMSSGLFPPSSLPGGDPRELLNSLGNATGY